MASRAAKNDPVRLTLITVWNASRESSSMGAALGDMPAFWPYRKKLYLSIFRHQISRPTHVEQQVQSAYQMVVSLFKWSDPRQRYRRDLPKWDTAVSNTPLIKGSSVISPAKISVSLGQSNAVSLSWSNRRAVKMRCHPSFDNAIADARPIPIKIVIDR